MNHDRVTIEQLRRQAEAHGVAASYQDWRGRRVEVGGEALRAILAALADTPPLADRPSQASARPLAAHPAPPLALPPPGRRWGFTVPLDSPRSRRSGGHGHLRVLAGPARW